MKTSLADIPISPDSPYQAGLALLNDLAQEILPLNGPFWLKHLTGYRSIMTAEEQVKKEVAFASIERSIWMEEYARQSWEPAEYKRYENALSFLRNILFCEKLAFTEAEILYIDEAYETYSFLAQNNWPYVVELIANYKERHGLTEAFRAILRKFRFRTDTNPKAFQQTAELLGDWQPGLMEAGPAWTIAALQDLYTMEPEVRAVWASLIKFAHTATMGRPDSRWRQRAQGHLNAVGADSFLQRMNAWFVDLSDLSRGYSYSGLSETNTRYLKGLVWMCGLLDALTICPLLGRLTEHYLGSRVLSEAGGNACIYTLGDLPGMEPIRELIRLQAQLSGRNARKIVGKALERAGQRVGLTRADMEEIGVPTLGLDADGRLRETLGDFTVEIVFTGRRLGEWLWFNAQGKPQKSVPAAVKREHKEALRRLKARAEEIQAQRLMQCDRIEFLLRGRRSWKLSDWQERYLNHPLLLGFSRRLIWLFQQDDRAALGIWHEGRMVDVQFQPLDWLSEHTEVRLWHPVGFDVEIVLTWRNWVETREVAQPFKQAHREAYLLTDAEIATGTYSNRFAAHIIRQWAFHKLCQQRGWKNRLRRTNDDVGDRRAILELPEWGLNAEFWLDPVDDEYTLQRGGFTYNYLGTDQVRFSNAAGDPVPLIEVPAQAFYEAMREVDLFIAATGIGADPEWQDRGENDRLQVYWKRSAFGGLTLTAETRRETIHKLLPRLQIASRCSLMETFLVVRGDVRTYKIHLGSGNILMEPNDQYLCIIRDRSAKANEGATSAYLPFEGDTTLAMILSKAFLLADDKNIKDPVILRQIQPHR